MKTKILPFSSAGWLFFCCSIYFIVGMINLFVYPFTRVEYIQLVWVFVTALPLFISMKWLVSVYTVWERLK